MSFVPLETAQPRVGLELPAYVPAEQIGINLQRLDLLATLGGFANGTTISSYTGQTTEYQHHIVGSDGDGAAFAGAASVRRAPVAMAEYESRLTPVAVIHDHPQLSIRVNMAEVIKRIADEHSRLRDPAVWSRQLNNAVLGSLRQATWNHYVGHPQYAEIAGAIAVGALSDGLGSLTSIITTMLNNNLLRGGVGMLSYGQRRREVCWSLTPGIHPDRALLVSGLSRALRVIKPLRQS